MDVLPHTKIEQAPYPPPVESSANDMVATERETLEALRQAPYLKDFIPSRQQSTLGALSKEVQHPAATLLQEYLEKEILVHIGPDWSRRAL